MEREHSEIHQVVEDQKKRPTFFYNALMVFSLLSCAAQCVLISKSVIIDKSIAITGLCLFFLAIFALLFVISLKGANAKLITVVGFLAPLIGGLVSFLVAYFLQKDIALAFVAFALSFVLGSLISYPSCIKAMLEKGEKNEK